MIVPPCTLVSLRISMTPSRMTIWSQQTCTSGNFSKSIGISDIHNPESWPELCATLEPNATLSDGH
eukprot:2435948-Karenia_brevis.AAC.1